MVWLWRCVWSVEWLWCGCCDLLRCSEIMRDCGNVIMMIVINTLIAMVVAVIETKVYFSLTNLKTKNS